MQATWGIGTTLKVPTDLTDLFAVANDGAAIRQRLLHEALAKDRCNHGHYHKNGLVHWSSHSQSTRQMLRYYLSALEMQRPFSLVGASIDRRGSDRIHYYRRVCTFRRPLVRATR